MGTVTVTEIVNGVTVADTATTVTVSGVGVKGDPGNDGADGAPGANGSNGTNGADGSDGLSAYEVAVANGFVGNEAAWLASLVGDTGEQGIQGIQGPPGNDGADGAAGYGVPVGGTTGQVLAKASATDYDSEWVDQSGGGGGSAGGVSPLVTITGVIDAIAPGTNGNANKTLYISAANELNLAMWIPANDMTISQVALRCAAAGTSNVKVQIYGSNSNNAPGALLANSGAMLMNNANSRRVVASLDSPVSVVAGQVYYIGYIGDVASGSAVTAWDYVSLLVIGVQYSFGSTVANVLRLNSTADYNSPPSDLSLETNYSLVGAPTFPYVRMIP